MNDLRNWYLYFRAIPKTVFFNFKYFDFCQAVKFPVIISHRVWLKKTKGRVELKGQVKPFMIKIGFGGVGIFDECRSRSIWEVSGEVTLNGRATIGHGSKICVTGKLYLGRNFAITAESTIVCFKRVVFGDDCLVSWDSLIMDTDFHGVTSIDGRPLNEDDEIIIGKKVWIGCRCLILKGSIVGDNSVIAAGTLLCKKVDGKNVIIGGIPGVILKKEISWEI